MTASPTSPRVFDIIAKEVGVPVDEVYDSDDFSDLGIDDVLSRTIIARARESLDIDLPEIVFQRHSSAEDLEAYLKDHDVGSPRMSRTPSTDSAIDMTFRSPPRQVKTPITPKGPLSILLQGKPASAEKTIFLLPDGSGSGMVYSQFPKIADSVCVIALNSPFLHDHGNAAVFDTTIEDLAAIWADEIRRRQPHGPYVLGGYSAGGYYSFEVAKRLRGEGERVEKLVLIDSPCRVEFEALPMEVIRFLSERNLLGNWGAGKKTPDWFVNHFEGTIAAVERYMPSAMGDEGAGSDPQMPDCYVLWAEQGVLQGADLETAATDLDMSVKITRFMVNDKKQTGFGLHGWDRLLPGANISVATVPGNHFSLVHPPNVSTEDSPPLCDKLTNPQCNSFRMLFRDILDDEGRQRQGER